MAANSLYLKKGKNQLASYLTIMISHLISYISWREEGGGRREEGGGRREEGMEAGRQGGRERRRGGSTIRVISQDGPRESDE